MRKITLMFLISVLLANVPAIAGDITWLGTTSSDFTNVNNWVGGVAPNTTSDRALFGSTMPPNQPMLMANRSVSGLVFQATTGGWILGGSGRTLGIGAAGIDDSANTSGTDTINANISFEWSQTWSVGTGGPGLMINGTGTVGVTGFTLIIPSGVVTLAVLDDTSSRVFTKQGSGTLAITGAAGPGPFGQVSLAAGTVIVGNKASLGSGGSIQFGLNTTNITLQASSDLSGANRITNSIQLNNTSSHSMISGSNNIEFGGRLYSLANSPHYLDNNLDNGKTLTINTWNLNENTTGNKSVTLGGTGNTTVAGTIANGVALAQDLIITNTGLTQLSASNAFTGAMTVNAGTVRLGHAYASPGGITVSGGLSAMNIGGGVVELANGDFTRGLGTGVTQVKLTAGGFSAYGAKRLANLGGASAGVSWNVGSFISTGNALILNSAHADSEIEFQNPINLAGAARTVQVNDNTATNSDFATLSGVVTNGGLVKTGAGKLVLAGSTNFFASGLTVSNGTLAVNGVTTSSVMTVVGGTALINGAYTGPVTVGSGGALGGTGTLAAANLTLQSNAVLSVTILDTLGHSDALTVTGVLSVTNVTLQVVNTNLLTIGQTYKVVNGSHSNAFSASNVPANWTIDYANPGFIQLRSGGYSGTMIKIQ